MPNLTGIAWADLTSNPWTGCKKKSEACVHCYAETVAERFKGKAFPNGFELTFKWHELDAIKKMRTYGKTIFVCSMSDFFLDDHEFDLPIGTMDAARDRCLEMYCSDYAQSVQGLRIMLLTKRAEVMTRYFSAREIPQNIMLGVTVESPRHYNRIESLQSLNPVQRFLSIEPLLAPMPGIPLAGIDLAIVGGESGSHLHDPAIASKRALVEKVRGGWKPRADRIDWVRDIHAQCLQADARFFFKQWGGANSGSAGHELDDQIYQPAPPKLNKSCPNHVPTP